VRPRPQSPRTFTCSHKRRPAPPPTPLAAGRVPGGADERERHVAAGPAGGPCGGDAGPHGHRQLVPVQLRHGQRACAWRLARGVSRAWRMPHGRAHSPAWFPWVAQMDAVFGRDREHQWPRVAGHYGYLKGGWWPGPGIGTGSGQYRQRAWGVGARVRAFTSRVDTCVPRLDIVSPAERRGAGTARVCPALAPTPPPFPCCCRPPVCTQETARWSAP
jgi:hypothetical protein